jgi:hypothetical protein
LRADVEPTFDHGRADQLVGLEPGFSEGCEGCGIGVTWVGGFVMGG